jgi:hypothetical protein
MRGIEDKLATRGRINKLTCRIKVARRGRRPVASCQLVVPYRTQEGVESEDETRQGKKAS